MPSVGGTVNITLEHVRGVMYLELQALNFAREGTVTEVTEEKLQQGEEDSDGMVTLPPVYTTTWSNILHGLYNLIVLYLFHLYVCYFMQRCVDVLCDHIHVL